MDRLHQRAGSRLVVDLHGRLDEVICLECGSIHDRAQIQDTLKALNPFLGGKSQLAPDGDAEVEESHVDDIALPACVNCQGTLKPNVVFFGGNVDRNIVQQVYDEISASDCLLIVGSSLKVFSGYRFCRHAANLGIPIASINPGVTRADDMITLRIQSSADGVLAPLLS